MMFDALSLRLPPWLQPLFAAEALAVAAERPRPEASTTETGLRGVRVELKEHPTLAGRARVPAGPPSGSFPCALAGLCEGMATARAIGHIADDVRAAAAEAVWTVFLAHWLPGQSLQSLLQTSFGVGLLAAPAPCTRQCARLDTVYRVQQGEAWDGEDRPARGAGLILCSSQSRAITCASGGSAGCGRPTPGHRFGLCGFGAHRSAVAHWAGAIVVRGTAARIVLVARRRSSSATWARSRCPTQRHWIAVSPLEGTPRVAPVARAKIATRARAPTRAGYRRHHGRAGGQPGDGWCVPVRFARPGNGPACCRLRSWRTRASAVGPGWLVVVYAHRRDLFPATCICRRIACTSTTGEGGRHPARWSLGRQVLRQSPSPGNSRQGEPSILPYLA